MSQTSIFHRIVLSAILIISVFGWLPLVRSIFDGNSYLWGNNYFGHAVNGAGMSGDLWYLVVVSAFGLLVLYSLQRHWRPLGTILATTWLTVLLVDSVYSWLAVPEGNWFHGDTLGIHLNLSLIAPVVFTLVLLASIFLCKQNREQGGSSAIPLQKNNRRRLLWLGALLPIQFVLLRFGQPHGLSDQIGVIITILQWLLMGWALAYRPRMEAA